MTNTNETNTQNGGFLSFLEMHPSLSIALLVIIATLVFISVSKNKNSSLGAQTQNATLPTNADTGSAYATDANGKVMPYIVGSNSFTTENYSNSGNTVAPGGSLVFNDPTTTTTTKTTTTTNNPPPIVVVGPTQPTNPVRATPVPPVVFTHQGARIWDQHYTFKATDTVSGVAWGVANYCKLYQGMPSSVVVTESDLRQHNPNSQFRGGDVITTCRWDKNVKW